MNFESLVSQGKIKPIKSSKQEIREILSLAQRDLKMAEFVITQDWDWAFSISYNAALQASRAFMYSKGYRAIYDTVGLITETEVKELLKRSREFVAIINDKLKILKNGFK